MSINNDSHESKRHVKNVWLDGKSSRKAFNEQPYYLAGLFTHRDGGVLYLSYRCPLCGEQLNVTRQLENNMPVNYETHVAGEMIQQLRADLAVHFKRECGSGRERREKTGEILFDKFMKEVYE